MQYCNILDLGSDYHLLKRLFLTREKGEQAYGPLKICLQRVPEGQALTLVFPPDQVMDGSFADASIIRLGEELVAGAFGERGLLLQGLTENSIRNLEGIIHLRHRKTDDTNQSSEEAAPYRHLKLAFLLVEPAGSWRCVGQLETSLRQTLDIVAVHDRLTAPQLAEMLDLEVNTASNRLKRLHDQRLIRREYEVSEKGLQYLYSFWH